MVKDTHPISLCTELSCKNKDIFKIFRFYNKFLYNNSNKHTVVGFCLIKLTWFCVKSEQARRSDRQNFWIS